jgi:small conductance mechanosensitive channel
VQALEAKLEQSRSALQNLLDVGSAEPGQSASDQPLRPQEGIVERQTANPGSQPVDGNTTPTDSAATATPLPQLANSVPPANSDEQSAADNTSEEAKPAPEVEQAQKSLSEAQAAAAEAEKSVASVASRLELLERSIQLTREARDVAEANAENAQETMQTLQRELNTRLDAGEQGSQLGSLRQQIQAERDRWRQFEDAADREASELDKLQAERAFLLTEQLTALRAAEEKHLKAEEAEKELQRVENPFSLRNLQSWVLDHGPRVFVIVLGMVVTLWLLRVAAHRIIRFLIASGGRGSAEEREQRAQTLVSVFQNTGRIVVYAGGGLMILDELSIPVAPLLGGVAVVGLAVAFGAQNLIKDYFYGFMILSESQYGVNDVVRIADTAGLVERITLRITVLRDLEGVVHFIPHGEVTKVSNMTHGWSRAMFDIGVAYKEDTDRVMDVLIEIANDLREDRDFAPLILDSPEMLGVDAFGDSSVVIKFLIKTKPLKQWAVKREMLRRIKQRFDELNIEIPFPHRTVFHRNENVAKCENAG